VEVPFFRPYIGDAEIAEVTAALESGWLTTGPRVAEFEERFRVAVGARYAVAVNSCTAAMHLALEALALRRGDFVLVPTLTFAATAEVVRYMGATPILVDCESSTLNMDLADAENKLAAFHRGELPYMDSGDPVGLIPVHVGGLMMDPEEVRTWADARNLWIVEDAAHAFPAAWRADIRSSWTPCGSGTARASCFSFYANKTITTGEGGLVATEEHDLAERIRLMSLHGLSRDGWNRYSAGGSWDYRIVPPGFKYNLTDIAAAIGLAQLTRAEDLRDRRERIALEYLARLGSVEELELPPNPSDRILAWHLFPLRLRLELLDIDRDAFIAALYQRGVQTSVHWRPLHLHPYYQDTLGWRPEHCPVASREWKRLISLPLFPAMTTAEIVHVAKAVHDVCEHHGRKTLT